MLAPWLHVAAGLFGAPNAGVPAPLGIAVVGLISFWAARAFLAAGWEVAAARLLSLGLWLALVMIWFGLSGAGWLAPVRFVEGVFSADRALIALLLVAGLAWWRGLVLGSEPNPFTGDFVRRVVLRAVAVLGVALVVGAVAGGPVGRHVLDSAGVALPVVLIAGLVAAAAVQVRTARARIRAGGNRAGLGWIGAALGLSVGIVLVALILAAVAGPDVWGQVLRPIDVLLGLTQRGLYWLLVAVAYVVFLILTPFIWLIRLVAGRQGQQQQGQQPGQPPSLPKFEQQAQQILPPWAVQALEVALVAGLVLLAIWLVLRSLRRYRAAAADRTVEEVHESVWSRDLALEQLRSWLRGLGPRRGGRAGGPLLDLDAAPVTVRDAYRRLLVLAARRGEPRVPAESPNDYAGRLQTVWADATDPLADLTHRYLAARYGERDSEQDSRLAREDWEAIRAYLSRQREAGGG